MRVVPAGDGDGEGERGAVEVDRDLAGQPVRHDGQHPHVGVLRLPVRHRPHGPGQPPGQLPGALVVGADDEGAAGHDPSGERLEGLVDLVHGGVVGVVVEFDVEDDRDLGGVLVEAAVALVGLGDEDLALAVQGVGTGRVEVAADRVRGPAAQLGERDGEHGGGGRLAVRAGDGDRAQPVHQPGERVRTVDDRDAALGRAGELRVVGADRGGDDDAAGVVGEVLGGVAEVHGDAERAQRVRRRRVLGVAAGDLRAALGEDLGDARHSGAADADEVRSVHGGGKAGCHTCLSQMRYDGERAGGAGTAYAVPVGARRPPHAQSLLWLNSLSTGTPTLCRARDAQSRWKNSST